MIADAIDKVLELQQEVDLVIKPDALEESRVFTKRGYEEVMPHEQGTLPLASLDPLCGFCTLDETAGREGLFITVSTDATVNVWGPPHPVTRIRESLARCAVPAATPITGLNHQARESKWMPSNHIIPLLLTGFEDNPDRTALLKVLGNVVDGAAATYQDDGVTQQVATKRGIALSGLTELPSPLTLLPLANYPEVPNVEQSYVLRAEGGDDEHPPQFILLRINDPTFEMDRAGTIREYLEGKLTRVLVL